MLKRSIQTAQYFDEDDFDIKQMRMLDELNAGAMEGLTYDEIKNKHPAEYEIRRKDKLHYRYPGAGGESYLDIINRLRAVIVEVERMTDHVLLVGHRSVARVLLAYFKGLKREEVADLDVPLGTLYMMEPVRRLLHQVDAELTTMIRNRMVSISRLIGTTLGQIGSIMYQTTSYVERPYLQQHSVCFALRSRWCGGPSSIGIPIQQGQFKHGVLAWMALVAGFFAYLGAMVAWLIDCSTKLLHQDSGSIRSAGTSCNNRNEYCTLSGLLRPM